VRDVGDLAAEQDAIAQLLQPMLMGSRKRHGFFDERGESHCGVEPYVLEVLADIEKLGVLRHSHVRDDQPQARVAAQQTADGLGSGVFARRRTRPAVGDDRYARIFDGPPDLIEQRVFGS
jgi:hypothetical protein